MDSVEDVLGASGPGDASLSPEKMAEVKELLAKMKAGFEDMTDEEKEEFRQGFVHKLAEKVRTGAAGAALGGAEAVAGHGVLLTTGSFLVLLVLFGLVGYAIYVYNQKEEARKGAKGRTKSTKKSKRKEKNQ